MTTSRNAWSLHWLHSIVDLLVGAATVVVAFAAFDAANLSMLWIAAGMIALALLLELAAGPDAVASPDRSAVHGFDPNTAEAGSA